METQWLGAGREQSTVQCQGLSADGTVCLVWFPRVSQDSKKRIYVRGQGLETYLMEKESTVLGIACQSEGVKLPNVM